MPQKTLVYRILIASPSDCIEERKIFPEVIRRWNASNSLTTSAILEPVLWETHANPEFGNRPQELLNKQLINNCDFLVGAFWTRLGTNTGKAPSGTAEEIEEFRKANKPILLYFSSLPIIPSSINQNQYKLLVEYKHKLEGDGIIFNYDSLEDLRNLFSGHLASKMSSIHKTYTIEFDLEEENEKIKKIRELELYKSNISSSVRKLKAEWELESDTYPQTFELNESAYILDRAISEFLDYKSQIISDTGTELTQKINEILKRLKIFKK